MIVYLVTNSVNGKRYVGLTSKTIDKRWALHISHAKSVKARQPLHTAIKKYGVEKFIVSVLEECNTENELRNREKFWINELDTFISNGKGYNATLGGDGLLGYKHTETAKKQMSESRKGEKNINFGKRFGACIHGFSDKGMNKLRDRKGEKNPMYGKTFSEESSKKLSQSLKDRHDGTSVNCFDSSGKLIATYISMREAAKAVCGQANKIYEVCKGTRNTHKGLRWQYASSQRYRGRGHDSSL